jgi:hypothetical protein
MLSRVLGSCNLEQGAPSRIVFLPQKLPASDGDFKSKFAPDSKESGESSSGDGCTCSTLANSCSDNARQLSWPYHMLALVDSMYA